MTTITDEGAAVIQSALDHLLDILTDELHDWDDDIFEGTDEAIVAWNQEVDYIHQLNNALREVSSEKADSWDKVMHHYPRR